MKINREHLGARVSEQRKNLRMTQGELAAKVGMSQTQMSEVENGNRAPSLEQAVNISQVLGIKIEVLAGVAH